ncbi:uncharacterized protein LOC143446142 [Clavelina lepadiformis]|uniref:uncharacterized protein LOC143446142 n=1 Tax=Clavelina lepadiformis TaxID=159417 RepID=UPI00404237F5
MNCVECHNEIPDIFVICSHCGHATTLDQDQIISEYFHSGYEYGEILQLLHSRHNYAISMRTLKRRLHKIGLRRKCGWKKDITVLFQAEKRIEELLDGPSSFGGYRSVWHTLQMEGLRVPRLYVADVLRNIDPKGCEARRAHRLRRREYHNPGPNYAWHTDGYDKLKPFGFSIHGAIDGFSRKVLWLNVTRSNKCPHVVANMYIKAVTHFQGCPIEVVSDLGTENGLLAAAQCFFRDNINSHHYVPSPRNQRIESWWSIFSRFRACWWRNFFSDLEFRGIVDFSQTLSKECLWYCFSCLIQNDLDFFKDHWNTHRIRKSRHNVIAGRPDLLYSMPERYGGISGLLKNVAPHNISLVLAEISQPTETEDYQEYFDYATSELGQGVPSCCTEALDLYKMLMNVARDR